MLFALGKVVATHGALDALEENNVDLLELLNRHIHGDWGCVPDADKQENQLAIEQGYRIMSSYMLNGDDKIWIITEADRSCTTLLLPDEY